MRLEEYLFLTVRPFDPLRSASMGYQHTLKDAFELRGIGIHTGEEATVRVEPAPVDHGLVFVRSDARFLKSPIKACIENLVESDHATTLNAEGVAVKTVEHVLAALRGMEVDNALIALDGPEVPILDGSALPYVEAIRQTGVKKQKSPRVYRQVNWSVSVRKFDKRITILPAPYFQISYLIEFKHPEIEKQLASFVIDPQVFAKEIAPARTFGFLADEEKMKAAGLGLGASYENALILDEKQVVNGPLRFRDEFVRHKILDAIGDLALMGQPLIGHVVIERGGHGLHAEAVKALLAEEEASELNSFEDRAWKSRQWQDVLTA